MSQCVKPAPDTGALMPVTESPCTGFVVMTPDEFTTATSNPFNLSPEDGAVVSASIAGVWCVAWAFRALYSVLRNEGEVSE